MTAPSEDANLRTASILIDQLVRSGISLFVISPGSRSTPLTVAAALNPNADALVHFDERGAAFFALGYARALGKPTALICTSGTAVANYLPAVIEGSQEMIPLVLLTADRPDELQDCGANQTIDQRVIFGKHARRTFNLPCPHDQRDEWFWRQTAKEAIEASLALPAGPVHLNLPFREPLLTDAELAAAASHNFNMKINVAGELGKAAFAPAFSQPGDSELTRVASQLNDAKELLIIAGYLRHESDRTAVCALAEKLGCPILADIRSGLRGVSTDAEIVAHYDLTIAADYDRIVGPDTTVLQFGGRLVSKALLQRLDAAKPNRYIQIDPDPRHLDPTHCVTDRIIADISIFCEALLPKVERMSESVVHRSLLESDGGTTALLQEFASTELTLSEVSVTLQLIQTLPEGSVLFSASSMPIRLLDKYAAPTRGLTVYANRGASGIDGTVASAAGMCAALKRRVTLFIGDLALLHDLNSLDLIREQRLPLTIVLLNNNGGGIFNRLPISKSGSLHDKYFVTPHGHSFGNAAAMFGISYRHPSSPGEFAKVLKDEQLSTEPCLIELTIDRALSLDAERSIAAMIEKRIGATPHV